MNAESLILLVKILDAGNLSAAARRLKMTRANVSYHLNRMERALGQQLVRRTTRSIEPTQVGLRLYEHGRSIQNELLMARDSVRELGQMLRGRIRLSVPSGFGLVVLADWLTDFKRLYPGIVLDVTFENRIQDMLNEEVDISIRVISNPPQHLVARHLGCVRFKACASQAYVQQHGLPDEPDELPNLPVITTGIAGRHLRLSATSGSRRHDVMLEPTLISENFLFLHRAITAGLGIGIVPDYLIQDDIQAGRVVTLLDDWALNAFSTDMYMLYMPNRYHTRSISTFIDYILERAKNLGALAHKALEPGHDQRA
jgi:DNA-binding transcriptional LysR family regulator